MFAQLQDAPLAKQDSFFTKINAIQLAQMEVTTYLQALSAMIVALHVKLAPTQVNLLYS